MYLPATQEVASLTNRLNCWRHEYYNLNAPTVSDEVYDRFFGELKRMETETGCRMANSPTRTVGYAVVEGLEKAPHPIPLLSLDDTKQISVIMRFIGDQQVLIMHKLDGLTVKLEYENGNLLRSSTRGDGNEGDVVTHNVPAIQGIPAEIPYKKRLVVTGETYIPIPTFERLKTVLVDSTGKAYKNARNMASGSVRCHDAAACAKRGLVFAPFNVLEGLDEDVKTSESKFLKLTALKEFGFVPCTFFMLSKKLAEDEVLAVISELQFMAQETGTPIDGIVFTYNDIPYSRSCGRTGHHYKDGFAFKFEDGLSETVLHHIEWTPSRNGELSPVAIYKTVVIDGCDVSRATLHNVGFIKKLELKPGCRILVSKRNMIIPQVEDNKDRGNFDEQLIPSVCPCCGTPTRIDTSGESETLHCDNPDCSTQRLRQFVHFVCKKAMDIEGLSEATLEKFIGKGWLNDFTDIFRLDAHANDIVKMDGFGEKSWTRLWDAIQESRNTTFEQYLISMDIPMVGRSASRELCRFFNGNLNAFETAVFNGFDFTQLNDFGDVLHTNIHEWFLIEENIILWEELQAMMNIEKGVTNTSTEAADSLFAGKTVVVTGAITGYTRNSINAKIELLGGKPGSSVSKNTDYVVCGEGAGSKLAKAREFGVTVLTEQQFLEIAGAA